MLNLDTALQLHEEIRIIYVVDGYVAELRTGYGDIPVCEAKGETVVEALTSLQNVIADKFSSLDEIRSAHRN
jgi:hypothetical protein